MISNTSSKSVSGLIITAGLSSRMGAYKPLLKFGEGNFIKTICLKLSEVCQELIVVGGFKFDKIKNEIDELNGSIKMKKKIRIVENEEFRQGMFSSLQKGIRNVNSEWTLYHFVDQPNIPKEFYREFISQIEQQASWIQPTYDEKKGHPILIHNNLYEIILSATPQSNLKLIGDNPLVKKKFCDCGYSQILQDTDTMEDYKKLIAESEQP